jgi:hypothetical protein
MGIGEGRLHPEREFGFLVFRICSKTATAWLLDLIIHSRVPDRRKCLTLIGRLWESHAQNNSPQMRIFSGNWGLPRPAFIAQEV